MNIVELERELTLDEGKRNRVYIDSVGIETIGVGRNLQDRGLSDDEIAYLLKNDISSVCADLDRELPWWRQMTDARMRALANMCFNLGINRLLGFKNTLAAMKAGDYLVAAAGMRSSKWASQVGARAERLAKMMEQG